MVRYKLVFTKQAQKDAKKISKSGLRLNVETILDILRENPYKRPPQYEKLVGDLEGAYSRRINIQHRVIYQVFENEKIVKIIRMWTHYE
jgi:Txe/YoeB family toxin of toxin-antitoxin system